MRLLIPTLLLPAAALAGTGFDGTWKTNIESVKTTGKPLAPLLTGGEYTCSSATDEPPMLPVKVSTPTVPPTERAVVELPAQTRSSKPLSDAIEIQLTNGHGIVVHGRIDTKVLARVIALLVRR